MSEKGTKTETATKDVATVTEEFKGNAKFGKPGRVQPANVELGVLFGTVYLRVTTKNGNSFEIVIGLSLMKKLVKDLFTKDDDEKG